MWQPAEGSNLSSSAIFCCNARNTKYVKSNARSIRNVPQQRVTLTVEIYKTGIFGNHLVDRFRTNANSASSSGLRVEMTDAAVSIVPLNCDT
jgi:hypothetical protein